VLMANVMTCKRDNQNHHCPICEKPAASECYENLHLAYCIAMVSDASDRDQAQVRTCGIRFAVESPKGCVNHTYAMGFNLLFKLAWKRQPCEMPKFLPHHLACFVYPELASGKSINEKAESKAKGTAGRVPLKSTKLDLTKAQKAADELNMILYQNPISKNIGAGNVIDNQGEEEPSYLFGLPQSVSRETEDLLCRMSGTTLETRHSKANAVPGKVVVALTAEEEEDANNWMAYENKKKELAQETHRDRQALKEEAAKNEEGATRKKGQAKQALALSLKAVKKGKKPSNSNQ